MLPTESIVLVCLHFIFYLQRYELIFAILADFLFLANTTRGNQRKILTVQISSLSSWRHTKRAAAVRALQAVGPNHPVQLPLAPKTLAARGETRTKKRRVAASRSGKKRWLGISFCLVYLLLFLARERFSEWYVKDSGHRKNSIELQQNTIAGFSWACLKLFVLSQLMFSALFRMRSSSLEASREAWSQRRSLARLTLVGTLCS